MVEQNVEIVPVKPEGSNESLAQEAQALTVAGNTQLIPIDRLFRQNNVRTAATLRLPEMIVSINRHGFKPNHPLVGSEKRDGRILVLCGNRRHEAVESIFANTPDVAETLFPTGCIPCVVYKGLTEEQEALLRIDHSKDEDRVPLDEWGEFKAIQQLVRAGYDTQAGIAEKMGWFKTSKKTGITEPNRSKVQSRVNLAQLPQFVQDEMARYCEIPGNSNLRWSSIAKLFKAYNEEYRQYQNGEGPVFTAAWIEAIAGKATVGALKPMTPAEVEKRSKTCGSPILVAVLRRVAGIGEDSLSDLDARAVIAEAAQAQLSEIADYLGESGFAELCDKAKKNADAEIDALVESVDSEVEAETSA